MQKYLFASVLLSLAACGAGEAATIEKYEGTASIDGKPAKLTSCKATIGKYERATFPVIEIGLDTGHTVIIDPMLGSAIRKGDETTKLEDCSRASYSGGSGGVAGAKVWDIGTAGLTCKTADGELVLDVQYDCGSKDRPSNRVGS